VKKSLHVAVLVALITGALGALGAPAAEAGTFDTVLASVGLGGHAAGHESRLPQLSDDGRYVAFQSDASNLVPGDTNRLPDIFVRDLVNGATTRVSISNHEDQGDGGDDWAAISGDGSRIAFRSSSDNLVAGDTNRLGDIFVRDRVAGTTVRVSLSSSGEEADGFVREPQISANGRFVAFQGQVANLVPHDTNGARDVFVHDLDTGRTTRVSVSSAGGQSNGESFLDSISGSGRFVSFLSEATNLVPGDTNGARDIFVHDRLTGETRRVSVSSRGAQGNAISQDSQISGNGAFVAFGSGASNLVPGDTNDTGDVFVYEMATRAVTRVSVDDAGHQVGGPLDGSGRPSISSDGRYVAFVSRAPELRPNAGVLVRDRLLRRTYAPRNSDGHFVGGYDMKLSGDGLHLGVAPPYPLSDADTNLEPDVYVHTLAAPVVVTTEADVAAHPGGRTNGFTILFTNPNSVGAVLTEIRDLLPSGFDYVPGSSSGITTDDPTVDGQMLQWPVKFVVPPGKPAPLHFSVSTPCPPGAYLNSATGTLGEGFLLDDRRAEASVVLRGNVIEEIFANSPGRDDGGNDSLNGEWVELGNPCGDALPLEGWVLRDLAGVTYTLSGIALEQGQTVRVHTGKGKDTSTDVYWGLDHYVWGNAADRARLLDGKSVVDSCAYAELKTLSKDCAPSA
jgi:uncharacterized repeat protein (TIGR01451 family)